MELRDAPVRFPTPPPGSATSPNKLRFGRAGPSRQTLLHHHLDQHIYFTPSPINGQALSSHQRKGFTAGFRISLQRFKRAETHPPGPAEMKIRSARVAESIKVKIRHKGGLTQSDQPRPCSGLRRLQEFFVGSLTHWG